MFLLNYYSSNDYISPDNYILINIIVYLYNRRVDLTRKEPVKPVEQDVYEEVQNPDVISAVHLTINSAYELVYQ